MTQETITRIKLTAADGMVLTDGELYGREIYLAADADPESYREITEAEYERIMEAQTAETEDDQSGHQ